MQVAVPARERNWAMAAHLSALIAIAGLPLGHVLGPFIVYLIKGNESEFVGEHARAALNYQITVSLFAIIALVVAAAFTFGFAVPMMSAPESTSTSFSLAAVWIALGAGVLIVLIASVLFIILGTIAASEGRTYAYPFAIRFIR
jgi:uncharacterized protein